MLSQLAWLKLKMPWLAGWLAGPGNSSSCTSRRTRWPSSLSQKYLYLSILQNPSLHYKQKYSEHKAGLWMQLPRTLFSSTRSVFLAENFPNDLYYFLGSLQDRSQSRCSTCFSDRPHSPNHRQSKSVTFLLQCPVVVAHVSVLPWGKYKVNGNLQNGSELFFKILLFVAQEILQTLFLSDKRAGNNTWFYTDVFLCIAPRSILQRKEAFNAPRNIKNKLHITNGVWLCTWHFPQSTWASLSVSNPFSKFQQDKFCIGPHGYQTPLLYLNPG